MCQSCASRAEPPFQRCSALFTVSPKTSTYHLIGRRSVLSVIAIWQIRPSLETSADRSTKSFERQSRRTLRRLFCPDYKRDAALFWGQRDGRSSRLPKLTKR